MINVILKPGDVINEVLIKHPEVKAESYVSSNDLIPGEEDYLGRQKKLLVRTPVKLIFSETGNYYFTRPINFQKNVTFEGCVGAKVLLRDIRLKRLADWNASDDPNKYDNPPKEKSCTIINGQLFEAVEGSACLNVLDYSWSEDNFFMLFQPYPGNEGDELEVQMQDISFGIEQAFYAEDRYIGNLIAVDSFTYFFYKYATKIIAENVNVKLENGRVNIFVVYDSSNITIRNSNLYNDNYAIIPFLNFTSPGRPSMNGDSVIIPDKYPEKPNPDKKDDPYYNIVHQVTLDGVNTMGGILWMINNIKNVVIENNVFSKYGNDELLALYRNYPKTGIVEVQNISIQNNIFRYLKEGWIKDKKKKENQDDIDKLIALSYILNGSSDSEGKATSALIENVMISGNTFEQNRLCNKLISIEQGGDVTYRNLNIQDNEIRFQGHSINSGDGGVACFYLETKSEIPDSQCVRISNNTVYCDIQLESEARLVELLSSTGVPVIFDNNYCDASAMSYKESVTNANLLPGVVAVSLGYGTNYLKMIGNTIINARKLVQVASYKTSANGLADPVKKADIYMVGNLIEGQPLFNFWNVAESVCNISDNTFRISKKCILWNGGAKSQQIVYARNTIEKSASVVQQQFYKNVADGSKVKSFDICVFSNLTLIGFSSDFSNTFPPQNECINVSYFKQPK